MTDSGLSTMPPKLLVFVSVMGKERKGLEDDKVTRQIFVSRSSHTWKAYGRNEKSGCLQLNPWDKRAGKASKAELGADIAEAHER